ncbi:TPA: hypothetical protein HA265_04550 [Candidatus Woesearchaeota archaeon]|nr:hypothetical protein [Candidatus Woesearchaeota archaeon]
MDVSREEITVLDGIVQRIYQSSPLMSSRAASRHLKTLISSYTGRNQIYDSSLQLLIDRVEGQSVLDIGACALDSSLDFLARGASYVTAVDYRPFHLAEMNNEELSLLIGMKALRRSITEGNLNFLRGRLGIDSPDLPMFDSAYFFFPPAKLVGRFPEVPTEDSEAAAGCFRSLVCYVRDHLVPGGSFTIFTEVRPPYLRAPVIDGLTLDCQPVGGSEELVSEQQRLCIGSVIPVRPAIDMAMTGVYYEKIR